MVAGGVYDRAVDLWAIGCVRYELWSGKAWFTGRIDEIFSAIASFNPACSNFSVCNCPGAADLMQQLCAADPRGRIGAKGIKGHFWHGNCAWPDGALSKPNLVAKHKLCAGPCASVQPKRRNRERCSVVSTPCPKYGNCKSTNQVFGKGPEKGTNG